MTQLTDKMEGDWEVEFDTEFDHIVNSQGGFIVGKKGSNFDDCVTGLDGIKAFIRTLLAAKDKETAEAYKKGFITGGLVNNTYDTITRIKNGIKPNTPRRKNSLRPRNNLNGRCR